MNPFLDTVTTMRYGSAIDDLDKAPIALALVHRLLEIDPLDQIPAVIADAIVALTRADNVRVWGTGETGPVCLVEQGDALSDIERALESALIMAMPPDRSACSTLDQFEDPALADACRIYREAGGLCQVRQLVVRGEVVGMVSFVCRQRVRIGESWRMVLRRYCESAAIAVKNAQSREELRRLAFTDPLTGLANRRRISDQMSAAGDDLAVLFVDFDGLRAVNEHLGYAAGDQVIAAVGDLLRASVGPGQLAGRLGGDEFVILVSGAGAEEAALEAERFGGLLDHLRLPADIAALFRGASVGWARARAGETQEDLLKRAASEMRAEKARRKGAPFAG